MQINVQYATNTLNVPNSQQLRLWAGIVLQDLNKNAHLTIRIVGEQEGAQLNEYWRESQGATNVLSFASQSEFDLAEDLLGDIVICAKVVAREALLQGKDVVVYWARMVIHGVLHLHGFDHVGATDAARMESMERKYLATLNYSDPDLN